MAYGPSHADREYAYSLMIVAGRAADEGPAEDNPELHRSVYHMYKDIIQVQNHNQATSSVARSTQSEEQRSGSSLELEAITYIANQRRALHNRRLFETSTGYYSVGHSTVEVGDICFLCRGANVPFVLRKISWSKQDQDLLSNQYYILIGEAYVQGIMKGEVLVMLEENLNLSKIERCLTERKIIIV